MCPATWETEPLARAKFNNMSVRRRSQAPDEQPRNILETIVWHKEEEIDHLQQQECLEGLKRRLDKLVDPTAPKDFLEAITECNSAQNNGKPAIIAEVKKASPSKGIIREDFDPIALAKAYERGGATCISVLTDEKFFLGSFDYLTQIRQSVSLPLLCKDFILSSYQIYMARLHGADAVLLIAAVLSDSDLQKFIQIVQIELGMTALVEVHTIEELDRVLAISGVRLVGINNRSLEDFSVSLETTCRLVEMRKSELNRCSITIVSESGLFTAEDIRMVTKGGVGAVLIGESLVKCNDPSTAIAQLLTEFS